MDDSFEKKCTEIQNLFTPLSASERYDALIELGIQLPPYPQALMTPDHIVSGCQSTMYLNATLEDGRLYFEAHSDALISKGLAALLISVYSGEKPVTIIKKEAHFISELGLETSLSPNRSNGLFQILLRMKQLALRECFEGIAKLGTKQ